MYSAPYGNNRDQVKYTRTKSLTWATSIWAGGIQNYEALHSLEYTIPQTLKYNLIETTLLRKECQETTAIIVEYSLPQDGLSSTIHTAVRYGP